MPSLVLEVTYGGRTLFLLRWAQNRNVPAIVRKGMYLNIMERPE